MRDNKRNKDRAELRLDRLHLVWLTLGFVVALGIVFALGVLVGKRQALLACLGSPADPLAQIDADGKRHSEFTFYERLTAPGARVASPRPAPPPKPVVTPAPAPPPAEPAPAPVPESRAPLAAAYDVRADLDHGPAESGDYTVQVSSFQTQEDAKAFVAALERKGYKPFVVVAEVSGKGKWYRVRLGAFKELEHANSAKELLAKADIPAWVLKTE